MLEAEGDESGRSVQREYRKKVIELKHELDRAAQGRFRSRKPPRSRKPGSRRLGEQIGDFLAEPSAGHLFIVIFVIALVVALTLVYALQ